MKISLKQVVTVAVFVLLGLAVCRAAKFRFQEREEAIRAECRAEMQKQGLTMGAAKAKYPTPEIHLVSGGCVRPGATGEVVVKGKFSPGTRFVFENDNLEVLKENLTATEYRATVKAAPGIGPQTANLVAISPVTGTTVQHQRAVTVSAPVEFLLNASNGWKVIGRPRGAKPCAPGQTGESFELHFFRPGETAPFEKRLATLNHSLYSRENYYLSIGGDAAQQGQIEDSVALMQRLADPKLTNAQREQILQQIQKQQAQMLATMSKAADPANIKKIQQQQEEFGCNGIYLEVLASTAKGRMPCSRKVGQLTLTGTMKPM